MSHRWGISGGGLCSFVVMKRNHDEVPVSITKMPNNPRWGVGVEDERQEDCISDDYYGAGQDHHQTNKHLGDKRDLLNIEESASAHIRSNIFNFSAVIKN